MKVMRFSKRLGSTDPAVQHQIPDDHSQVLVHLIFCTELIVCFVYCSCWCVFPLIDGTSDDTIRFFNITLNVQEWQCMLEEITVCDVRSSLNFLVCEVQICTIC